MKFLSHHMLFGVLTTHKLESHKRVILLYTSLMLNLFFVGVILSGGKFTGDFGENLGVSFISQIPTFFIVLCLEIMLVKCSHWKRLVYLGYGLMGSVCLAIFVTVIVLGVLNDGDLNEEWAYLSVFAIGVDQVFVQSAIALIKVFLIYK